MGELSGKACLVTGGSRGIGRAIALELGRQGASVAVGYAHNKEAAEEVAQRSPEWVASRSHRLRRPESEAVEAGRRRRASSALEKIDVLVDNAGITRDRSLAKMSREEWDAVIQTNLTSVFHLTSRVLPHMVRQATAGSST